MNLNNKETPSRYSYRYSESPNEMSRSNEVERLANSPEPKNNSDHINTINNEIAVGLTVTQFSDNDHKFNIDKEYSSEGILACNSYLSNMSYHRHQVEYFGDGDDKVNMDEKNELTDETNVIIDFFKQNDISVTSQLLSAFEMGSLLYRGQLISNKEKVLVRVSTDSVEHTTFQLVMNEWFILSEINPIKKSDFLNKNNSYLSDQFIEAVVKANTLQGPTTLPSGLNGILYPTKALTLKSTKDEAYKKFALVYKDNDYETIKQFYKSKHLSSLSNDTRPTKTPSFHSNSTGNSYSATNLSSSNNYSYNNHSMNYNNSGNNYSSFNQSFNLNPLQDEFSSLRVKETVKYPFEIVSILTDILKVLKTLSSIHELGIVHNSITANTILKSTSNPSEIKLIGFEHSFSIQPEDCSNAYRRPYIDLVPEFLPYMSPETVGDSYKGSDYRTDFYSIGVILYELVVGRLPFKSDSRSKLIRMHMFHKPISPIVIGPEWITEDLNNFILKLLEKDPWKRYSDCISIINDLVLIKNSYIDTIYAERDNILNVTTSFGEPTELLAKDEVIDAVGKPPVFVLSRKIFGRANELNEISQFHNSISTGISAIVISGPSGSGKTSILHDLEDQAISNQEFYFYWNFEKFGKKSVYALPFHGIRQCLSQILSLTKEDIEKWRHRLISHVPVDLGLIINVIPELKVLLGPKYIKMYELETNIDGSRENDETKSAQGLNEQTFNTEIQIRYIIKSLFGLFAQQGLTVFADDIQFCGDDEWRLLAEFFNSLSTNEREETVCLKYVLGYEEGDDDHNFTKEQVISFLKDFDVSIKEQNLEALSEESYYGFWKYCSVKEHHSISDKYKYDQLAPTSSSSMNMNNETSQMSSFSDEVVTETSRKLHEISDGNILIMKYIIRYLFFKGYSSYIKSKGSVKGKWNIEFPEHKLKKGLKPAVRRYLDVILVPETKKILSLAALIPRASFSLFDLTKISNLSIIEISKLLNSAVESRIIIPTSPFYKLPFHLMRMSEFPFEVSDEEMVKLAMRTTYSFFHDSIKDELYDDLKANSQLLTYHKECALNYFTYMSQGDNSISEYLLMAHHFKESVEEAKPEDYDLYFEVLIKSGRFSFGIYNLYDSLEFFQIAKRFVRKDNPECKFRLLLSICQLYFCLEEYDKCLSLMHQTDDEYGFDKTTFLITRIRCLFNLQQYEKALEIAIYGLKKFGIDISFDPEECKVITEKYKNEIPLSLSEVRDIRTLKKVDSREITLIFEIMSDLIQPIYYSDKNYIKDALASQMIVMMVKHGVSAFCAIPLLYYANSLAKSGEKPQFLRGAEYAKLALALIDADETIAFSNVQAIYEIYVSSIAVYIEPLNDVLKYHDVFLSSTRSFFRTGMASRDMITGLCRLHLLYMAGYPVDEIMNTIYRQEHENYMAVNVSSRNFQINSLKLIHGEILLTEFEKRSGECQDQIDYKFCYNFVKIWYLNCYERYEESFKIITEELMPLDEIVPNTLIHVEFYLSVVFALSSPKISISPEFRTRVTEKIFKMFTLWNETCPVNFHSKYLLVKALLRNDKNMSDLEVLDLFEESIDFAKNNGNWNDAAMANFLCALWLSAKDKNNRRIAFFVKNGMALFKSLDLKVMYERMKSRFAENLKNYNWAGIDSIDGINSGAISPSLNSPNPLNRKLNLFFTSPGKSLKHRNRVLSVEKPDNKIHKDVGELSDRVDLTKAVQACLEISESNSSELILMKLLKSTIMFSDVDYGVVVIKNNDEPYIQAIGSPNNIYNLENEPLSSRTDLCPFSLILHIFNTGEIVNQDEDKVLFETKFAKDDYYKKNQCLSMICIPLKSQRGVSGALYLESQRKPAVVPDTKEFFSAKKRDLLDLLCAHATVSLTKIELYTQMEHAKRIAEDATAEKASFLANMSHEIRTPFNSLLSCSIFLLDTDLNKSQKEYVETIRSSAMVTLNIIDGILAFSKIEHGSFTLANEPFSFIESVENAIQLVGEQAAINNLELVFFNKCPYIKNIIGDETRFRQIVINLVGNAVKFTTEGHIIVEVSSREITETRNEITVSVKDSGIGIPQDSMNKVFGAFSQVDSSSRRIYGGSGLGLAISKKLADLMGGTLTFDSTEGKGSTFYFVLNAEVELEKGPVLIFDEEVGKNLGVINKALIIDDHRLTRQSLKQNLEWFGLQVGIVDTVKELDSECCNNISSIFVHYEQFKEFHKIRDLINSKTKIILISQFGKSLPKEVDDGDIFSVLLVPFQKPKITELIRNLINSNKESSYDVEDKAKTEMGNDFAKKYPLKILIAEDNLINLKVALQHLKKLGYAADHAKDGVEVVDKCLGLLSSEEKYDVILMDIQMPRKDGITTAIELKELFTGDNKQEYLPEIVALTANVAGEDRMRSLQCGMIDFVSKPILPDNLKNVLRAIGERKIDLACNT